MHRKVGKLICLKVETGLFFDLSKKLYDFCLFNKINITQILFKVPLKMKTKQSVRNYIIILVFVLCHLGSLAQEKMPEMILVKGGTYTMGNNNGEDDEKPAHSISISEFYIGKYEITVAQYKRFCKETNRELPAFPSKEWYEEYDQIDKWVWKNDHPIVNVSWNDAMAYCKWLSQLTNEKYTLPTEAQWEYAARGGQGGKGFKYSGSDNINEVAWYDETSYEKGTRPVGKLRPNEIGVYDMSGNAWEWCLDYYSDYSTAVKKDPTGPSKGKFKVVRGGGWYYTEDMCRVYTRDGPYPYYSSFNHGFRIVKLIQ